MAEKAEPGFAHNMTPQQLQQTYKTLKVILADDETFHHVVVEIF